MIGTGHFMRCVTLADQLKQRGRLVRFISRHLPGHLKDLLLEKGHEFNSLASRTNKPVAGDSPYAEWLGCDQHDDAKDSLRALSDDTWDWLVVDHYALDSRWETAMRGTARNIFIIDDIADRPHDCDVLLDQNFYSDMGSRYLGKVPDHCRLLLGPRYALLRDDFPRLRKQVKLRRGVVERVLVFFGGMDSQNYTGRAIEALADAGVEGLQVDVVIGEQHVDRVSIVSACEKYRFNCHVQTKRMAELMARADLAVGAGGGATWERCCLGLPVFAISTAGNQVKQVADAASEGLLYAPELKGDLSQAIRMHLRALSDNPCLLQAMSKKAMQAVDGYGTSRVIESLGCSGIEIRVATQEDSVQLFKWRNHPDIRIVSRSPDPISWDDHQRWFATVLASKEKVLLIGQRSGVPVGVVRFDIRSDVAEISIYLVPENKPMGEGSGLLLSAEEWFAANYHDVCKIHAHVLGSNERSQRLFANAGYQVESTYYLKRLHEHDQND